MRGRLSVLLASILLAAPALLVGAPAATAGPDPATPLVVPAPRVGDSVALRYDDGQTETYQWVGPAAPMRDGLGVERLASPIEIRQCDGTDCNGATLWFDLGTRDMIASPGIVGSAMGTSIGLFGETVEQGWTEQRHEGVRQDPVPYLQFVLQGRTLAPGASFARELPPFPWMPERHGTVTYRGIGWEDVDGAPLFHVDVEEAGEDVYGPWGQNVSYWYDGVHSLPALTRWTYEGENGTTTTQERRLVGAQAGEGDVLAAPADPPAYASTYVDAPTATYTVDGPSEPVLGSFSLQGAAAAARRDASASSWFLDHPGAFLYGANFQEDFWTATVEWDLSYLAGRDTLEVVVDAPFVPGQHTPDELGVATSVTPGQLYVGFPDIPSSLIVGQEVACGAHATQVAAASASEPLDGGPTHVVVASGSIRPLLFWVAGNVTVSLAMGCQVTLARQENDDTVSAAHTTGPAGEGVEATHEETWPEASAIVFARGGCVLVAGGGRSSDDLTARAGTYLVPPAIESVEDAAHSLLPQ